MDDVGPTTLESIAAIGSIVTPFLIAALSAGILWFQRRADAAQQREEEQRERAQRLEEGMRADRIEVYDAILEPFIVMFADVRGETNTGGRRQKGKGQPKRSALEIMRSTEYRTAAFKLSLFASDDVVWAFNNLMQFAYQMPDSTESNSPSDDSNPQGTIELLRIFGELLLSIRKGVGNEDTQVGEFEMLEWLIIDLRQMIESLTSQAGESTSPDVE